MGQVHLRGAISPQLLVQQQDISYLPWLAGTLWFIGYVETLSSPPEGIMTEPGRGVSTPLHPPSRPSQQVLKFAGCVVWGIMVE